MPFDFDEWMKLFRDHPEEAERRREEEIKKVILSAPRERQERLWQLQWRIDQERERHKHSPLGSCIALNQMLMEKVYGRGGFLESLRALSETTSGQPTPPRVPSSKLCKLLPFSKR